MPWNTTNYPPSYKYLSDETRNKAIDIANALLRQGMDEQHAIRTAREQAVRWARSQYAGQGAQSGLHQHVIPTGDGWGVQSEGADQPSITFRNKDEALNRAREIARNYQVDVIIHDNEGNIQERSSYA